MEFFAIHILKLAIGMQQNNTDDPSHKDLIISNAWSSKLRWLKLYLISEVNIVTVLEYDIMIPRKGKADIVTELILHNHNLKEELTKSKKYLKILIDLSKEYAKKNEGNAI